MIRRFEVRLGGWLLAQSRTKSSENKLKRSGEVKKCVVIVILVDINLSFRFPRLTTKIFVVVPRRGPEGAPHRMLAHITRPDRHENAKAERKNVYDNLTNPSIICSFAYFGG